MSETAPQPSESWTIQRVLTWSTDYLKAKSDSPRLDAEVLLAHALGVTRIHLYTHFDKPLSAIEREPFKQFLMRRGVGEPVAYITGSKEFMGLSFLVTKAVLIPRPDTEVLVEAALEDAKTRPEDLRILDVGTGSGCIAIALGVRLAKADIAAWDIDDDALLCARANATRHACDRLRFERRDALEAASWADTAGTIDLLVANPPYIAAEEAPTLPTSVAKFEPHRALFAAEGGLIFYRMLAERAAVALRPGGTALVEIGKDQGKAVAALFQAAGFADVTVRKDYAKLDRVVIARRFGEGA